MKNSTYYKSGVYALKAIESDLVYIGSTKCFKTRKNLHISALRKNNTKRCVAELLKAYHNGELIEFEILEVCENYTEREQYWIDFYKNHPTLKLVNQFDAIRKGSSINQEFRDKMSLVLKERWKNSKYRKDTIARITTTQFKKGTKSQMSKVTIAELPNGTLKEFESAKQAANYFNYSPEMVRRSINENKLYKTIRFYYKNGPA